MDFDWLADQEASGSGDKKDFPLRKPGYYRMIVDGWEFRETKKKKSGQAQKGLGLSMTLAFTAGNGKLFHWFNMENDNAVAEQIGRSEFKSLCDAVGAKDLTKDNMDEKLGDKFLYIKLVHKMNDFKGKMEEVIKEFKPDSIELAEKAAGMSGETGFGSNEPKVDDQQIPF